MLKSKTARSIPRKGVEIQEGVESIVEREMNLKLDKDSYSYYRFTMHIRYLIQRLMSGTQSEREWQHGKDAGQ